LSDKIIIFFINKNDIVAKGLRYYIILPLFYSISIPFFQWLYSIHLDIKVRNAQIIAIVSGILLNLILSEQFSFLGTIVGSIFAEFLLLFLLCVYALKNGFRFKK